jgi:hypothetical protein
MEVLPLAVLYDTLGLLGNRDSRGSGGAAHESVCNFVSGYPFRIHPGCCSSFRLRSGVPLYDLWRVCSRWLGHWSQRTERMPCHDTPASFLPEWPRMEASPTRLWAERQGLDRNVLVGIPPGPLPMLTCQPRRSYPDRVGGRGKAMPFHFGPRRFRHRGNPADHGACGNAPLANLLLCHFISRSPSLRGS